MLNSVKRFAVCLLAVLILLAALPAAAEGETCLQLTFIGMYANSEGSYTAKNLSGTFDVYRNGKKIGTITADENGSEPMKLDVSGNVQLIPVMDTISAEIPVNKQGYTVSIVEGRTNFAPVVVYADAGLFRVHTESRAEFSLISEEGETVLTFATDSKGDYALPVAIPAGQYTLRMENASLAISRWRDKIINVQPYTGPDSVILVDASYYFTPEITLKPATPTPAPTATPKPTATPVPTATPAPSEKPTESLDGVPTEQGPVVTTAVPTATPTVTPPPTATPVPTNGTLVLQATGDREAGVTYMISAAGRTYATGTVVPGTSARIPDLYMGNYIVTLVLPEDVMLTALNRYPSLQRGSVQWLVSISGGKTSSYEVELSRAGSISGEIIDVTDVPVTISGTEVYSYVIDGAFSQTGMAPDTYTVTCVLPLGEYTGEGWSFVETAGQMLAITKAEVTSGAKIVLPPIEPIELGSISGCVTGLDGQPLPGIKVRVVGDNGIAVSETVTAQDGSWIVTDMASGSYTVEYDGGEGVVIPAEMTSVTEDAPNPVVTTRQTNPASLHVSVFDDANNNGVLGKNEPYVAGAVISLISVEGGNEIVAASVVTGEDGQARLHVPEGEYILRCELPLDYGYAKHGDKDLITNSSMEMSSDRVQEIRVTLAQGMEREVGVGAMQMAVLCGTVWHDVNSDGLWQADEPGVAGVKITADGTKNGLHYETETDSDGRFEIRQIRNGTYSISYYVPDGYVFTYKANGPKEQRSLMTTEADRIGKDQIVFDKGNVVDDQNIGLVTECVVEGVCFLDANYNGIYDEGEEVLPGVQLEIFRQSNSKRLRTVTSDSNGMFRFGNLRGDTFKVKALLPQNHTFSINIPGNPDANQFAPRDGRREQVVMNVEAVNGKSTRVNLGAISFGSISGVVYFDDNFSGDWEQGEKIAAGIVVTLLDGNGEAIKSAKTNKNGAYAFEQLAPGEYTLSCTPKAGYAFTTPGAGSIMSNVGGRGVSDTFELSLGQDCTGMNAGMIVPSAVKGVVFADANDNGLKDASETGFAGTVVSLMAEGGPVDSITVGADGAFAFEPVMPGRYYLRYELPDQGVFSPVAAGGNQILGEGSDGAGDWFNVSTGETYTAPVCGGLHLGVISGYTFGDSDGSGAKDQTEMNLTGVTLTLTPGRDDLTERVVVTGADGSFEFADLRPDTYTLTVACPEGYVLSLLPDVTLPLNHGVNDQTVTLRVDMGSAWTQQPLGCVKPSSYTGFAWLDENLNGLCDTDERAAVGETILMIEQRSGDVVAQMTTDDQGFFRAEGLAPGMYTVAFALTDDVMGAQNGDSTFTEADGRLVMRDISIVEGTEASGARLGIVRETTLQGCVWLDHDGSTKKVEGSEVTLNQNGTVVAQKITGSDGLYTFDGLMPGEYSISVQLPNGCLALEPGDRRTEDGDKISILESNNGSTGVSGTITVKMNVHQLQLDIGCVKQGRLGDFCWLDMNGNGLQDEGDNGIPGVKIDLVRNGEVVASTISDQYGYYAFEALYPGEYILRVSAPAEVVPTVMRTDMPQIVSVLTESGESVLVPVESAGVNYAADLGFVLVEKDKYPAGYGEGATQDWTKLD